MTPDIERLKRINSVAAGFISREEFPGISWSIEHRGECISEGAVGCANVATQTPLDLSTIHRIYSMTKPMVSILCLKLIEAGIVGLTSPISDWLPGFTDMQVHDENGSQRPANRLITIEDLLTHRSGISYDFLLNCPVAALYREKAFTDNASRSLKSLVDEISTMPLAFQPGQKWHYSLSIDVLAHVLEVATGTEFSALLKSHIQSPLKMIDTDFKVEPGSQHRLASMYGLKHLGTPEVPEGTQQTLISMDVESGYPINSHTFVRGGHGLYSTISDYRRFMQVLETGKTPEGHQFLSKPMHSMMWTNRLLPHQMPINIEENIYSGYGWNLFGRVMHDVGQAGSLTGAGEGGWGGAASTYFWIDRELEFSGILMTQYLGSLKPLADDIRSAAYQALV